VAKKYKTPDPKEKRHVKVGQSVEEWTQADAGINPEGRAGVPSTKLTGSWNSEEKPPRQGTGNTT